MRLWPSDSFIPLTSTWIRRWRHSRCATELIGGATRRAFVAVIDLCLAEQVDALPIAGDLYDGEQTSMKTARFLADQLRRLDEAGSRRLSFVAIMRQSPASLGSSPYPNRSRSSPVVRKPCRSVAAGSRSRCMASASQTSTRPSGVDPVWWDTLAGLRFE
jgi:hypothetical protein